MKAGFDININPQFQTREKNLGGIYTFSTMADYLAGKINRYQQALAADGALVSYDATQKDYAAFVQDAFQMSRSLTVTAGLRWDGQVQPQPPRDRRSVAQEVTHLLDVALETPKPLSIVDLRGLGKEHWRDLDAGRRVQDERSLWD